MNQYRGIELVFKGTSNHMVGNGFKVTQYFPGTKDIKERFSPFVLLDYNAPHYFPPSDIRLGVDAHPHRGFETVTIVYNGKVEHHDNKGNHGVIGPGDVQWMTAGSGVLHKEYHETEFNNKGGIFHVIQLWVNLPKDKKMTEPKYQTLLKENMGKIILEDKQGEVAIIAGEVMGVKGPAQTFTNINMYNVSLKNNGSIRIQEPGRYHTGMLVLSGDMKINDTTLCGEKDFVLFDDADGDIKIEAISENADFIVLSGEPINEPIIAYGPFVMNTEQEIYEAYDDLRNNKFGPEYF